MDDLELLTRVREKLARPEAWTKGAHARNADGRVVRRSSPVATCWCLAGAALNVGGGIESASRLRMLLGLEPGLPDWNDAPERTHAEVLARLDAAIKERSHAG